MTDRSLLGVTVIALAAVALLVAPVVRIAAHKQLSEIESAIAAARISGHNCR